MPCICPHSMDNEELLLAGSTLMLGNEEELLKARATARDVLLLDHEGPSGQLGTSTAVEKPSLLILRYDDKACGFFRLRKSGIFFRLHLHLFKHGLIGLAGCNLSTPPRRQRRASGGGAHSSLRWPFLRAYRWLGVLPPFTLLLRLPLLLLQVW